MNLSAHRGRILLTEVITNSLLADSRARNYSQPCWAEFPSQVTGTITLISMKSSSPPDSDANEWIMIPQQPQEPSAWNRWLFYVFGGLFCSSSRCSATNTCRHDRATSLNRFFCQVWRPHESLISTPGCSKKLARVFRKLKERGYEPRVTRAYRSREMQSFYHSLTKILNTVHLVDVVDAPPERSCHSRSDGQGETGLNGC